MTALIEPHSIEPHCTEPHSTERTGPGRRALDWTMIRALLAKDIAAASRSKAVVIPMLVVPFVLLVPPIAFISGFGWSSFGLLVAATFKTIDSFSYVQSTVITPLFLVAGSFFPIDGLPHWAQVAANANPLYHCVQLVRNSVVYGLDWIDLWHAGFLLVFALVMWRLAIWRSEKRLIV